MKTTPKYISLVFALVLTSSVCGAGQQPAERMTRQEKLDSAYQQILELRERAMLVRLPGERKKLDSLDAYIARHGISEGQRRSLERMRERTIRDRDRQNARVAQAFEEHFDFVPVAFFYDHDTRMVVTGKQRPLKSDLITEWDLDSRDIYVVCTFGRGRTSRAAALVLLDTNLRRFERPFPNDVLISGFAALWGSITGRHEGLHVAKLNQMLWDMYFKAGGG